MSYADYLFNLPNISWMGLAVLFFLILLRLAPVVVLAPFLGAKVAPIPVRMGLVLSLSAVFMPILAPHITTPLGFSNAFIGYAIKELIVGLILGFFVSIPFFMVQTSGILIDYLRGASIMQSQDPAMQNQASPIGIMYNYILIVIFFQMSGPFLFFDAVVKSYEVVPPDSYLNPLFFSPKNPFWKQASDLINQILTIGIQLAAPALLAILMAEIFLGIANRLAPQVQIAFLGMSLKSFLGLMLLWAAWFFILKQFSAQTMNWMDLINKIVHYMSFMT